MILHDHALSPLPVRNEETVPLRARTFLLSPANASGIKGQRLLSPTGQSDLAVRLRDSGAPLGEVYRFISSLYFRGKLDYAEKFQSPPRGVAGVHIITGAGLMLPERVVTLRELRRISAISIDAKNSHYRLPLDSDLLHLRELVGNEADVILLGSIATSKYVTPLQEVFEERLLFPRDFLGRGDMSRGSMLLRCCAEGSELAYLPVGELHRSRVIPFAPAPCCINERPPLVEELKLKPNPRLRPECEITNIRAHADELAACAFEPLKSTMD